MGIYTQLLWFSSKSSFHKNLINKKANSINGIKGMACFLFLFFANIITPTMLTKNKANSIMQIISLRLTIIPKVMIKKASPKPREEGIVKLIKSITNPGISEIISSCSLKTIN